MTNSPCKGFKWVGQSFKYCDECGQPFWEHTHDSRLVGGAFDADPWEYVLIPDDLKARVKAKWDGP